MASAAFCNVTPCSPACSSFVDSARDFKPLYAKAIPEHYRATTPDKLSLAAVRRPCVHYRVATGYKLCLPPVCRPCVHYRATTGYRLLSAPVCRSSVHLRALTGYRLLSAPVCRPCVHYRVTTPYKLSLASCCRLFERRGLRCRRKSNYVILDRCRRPHFQNHGRRRSPCVHVLLEGCTFEQIVPPPLLCLLFFDPLLSMDAT